jgi:SRSO17 transposase
MTTAPSSWRTSREPGRVRARGDQLRRLPSRVCPLVCGRTEARERSEQYLRGLLVQQTDRCNAENLAEVIAGATPRALQRFPTEATWSDQAVTSHLQAYVGRRLGGALKVYIVDDTSFVKQGRKSVGVVRQYSGRLGKVANC